MGGLDWADGAALAATAVPFEVRAVETGSIGLELEQVRQSLMAAGAALGTVLEPAGARLVANALELLGQQVTRIAVIGQIKSGKSSFINALVQHADLLPTDVNPWTTAVTRLNLGQGQPGGAQAVFQFFSEAEWQRLAEGGGRLRELTERLVPGFEPELLRRHVTAVREQAAERLGPDYALLLGQSHGYDGISADLLKQYVCAGDYPGTRGTQANVGRYSDITKSADLYLDGSPFAGPVTVIDTPGTNDPFLIRDEITRSCLETADIYVVVLTARQPLAEADLALLRILRGLNRSRILVFVNRIDDLDPIADELDEVLAHVRKRLAAEFGDAAIPVLAGSARWATRALGAATGAGDLGRTLDAAALTYLARARAGDHINGAAAGEGARGGEQLRRALLAASGLPAVHRELARLIASSHPAHVTRQIAHAFLELTRSMEQVLNNEHATLERLHGSAMHTAEHAGGERERMLSELRTLEETSSIIQRSAQEIARQLGELIRGEMEALRGSLVTEVDVHARKERDVLIHTLEHGHAPRTWRYPAVELRRRLADHFLAGFTRAEGRILDLHARVRPELQRLIELIAPGRPLPGEPNWASGDVPTPAMSPLSRMVALDLDIPWWRAWWRGRPKPTERGRQLEKLVREEFHPVVDDLIQSATLVLEGYARSATGWSVGICESLIETLRRRRLDVEQELTRLQASVDGRADAATVKRQREMLSRIVQQIATLGTVGSGLATAARDIDRLVTSGGRDDR